MPTENKVSAIDDDGANYSLERVKLILFSALVAVHYPFPPDDWSPYIDASKVIYSNKGVLGDDFVRDGSPSPAASALEPFRVSVSASGSNDEHNERKSREIPEQDKTHQIRFDELPELAKASSQDTDQVDRREDESSVENSKPVHDQGSLERIITPLPNDVMFGKGGRMKHPGNEMFRAACQRLAPRFFESPTSTTKHELALELVKFIHRQGGRFLVEDRNNKGTWKLARADLAHKKARQLLADVKKKQNAHLKPCVFE